MVFNTKKMKNILITGGLGFIGTKLAEKLISKKLVKQCVLLDNFGGYINPSFDNFRDYRKLRLKKIKKNKFVIERADTNNFKSVLKIMEKYKPEIVFHTAALPLAKVSNVNADEAKQGSIDSTVNLIDAINLSNKKKKFKRFIYISSSMVYGDFVKNIVNEDDQKKPKEAYGIMKYCGEKITEGLCRLYKIDYSIIRPSAVYGPTDMNRRVSQLFVDGARNNKKLKVEGVNEKLDFTFIDDLAEGLILSAFKKKAINQVFNMTFGKGRKLIDFIKILKKHYPKLRYEVKSKDKTKPSRGTLSILKAKKLIGYKPKFNLEKGIKNYLKFLKEIDRS